MKYTQRQNHIRGSRIVSRNGFVELCAVYRLFRLIGFISPFPETGNGSLQFRKLLYMAVNVNALMDILVEYFCSIPSRLVN